MSKTVTITEALADLKVIAKRIESKQSFVGNHMARVEQFKDPLAKDGGSAEVIRREMQALNDLYEESVSIRRAIAAANAETTVSVNGSTRTVADWLVWRREVAPGVGTFLRNLASLVQRARDEATRKGGSLVTATASVGETKPSDIIVNMSEVELSQRIEMLAVVLETLDGQLSLKNATVMVTY